MADALLDVEVQFDAMVYAIVRSEAGARASVEAEDEVAIEMVVEPA